MTSSNLQDVVDSEPPRKRQRTYPATSPSKTTSNQTYEMDSLTNPESLGGSKPNVMQIVVSDSGFQPEREAQVGILHFVNADSLGFTGTLKQRYSDFLVNEIAPDGSVVHLTDDQVPKIKDFTNDAKDQDRKLLTNASNGEAAMSGEALYSEPKLESLPLPIPMLSENASVTTPLNGVTTFAALAEGPVLGAPPVVELAKASSSTNDESPIKPVFVLVSEDDELLTTYFGATLKDEIIEFHEKILLKPRAKPATFGFLFSGPITDRPLRGRLHQDVRRIFESRIETESQEDGRIKLSAAQPVQSHPEGYIRKQNTRQQNPRSQAKGKLGWQELGGEHLHFSLYKENKDTMEVIGYLCKMLKVKPKDFAFAGTKDRRAITVQRVSVYRQHANALAQLNRSLRQARAGNFKHEKHRLELGELQGNQFTITLRDCHFGEDDSSLDSFSRLTLAKQVVGQAVESLQADGFLNYFGLQRFGTFGIGTNEVGKKILQEDFEGAVWAILHFSDDSLKAAKHPDRYINNHDRIARDDLNRALAIDSFKATGKSHHALEKLPRKFSAEAAIIRHLGFRQTDFAGALSNINRNLRTMYVHAYQSLVWNVVASERWSRFGNKVIKGDLVLIETPAKKAAEARDEVDENGEVVIHAAADDSAFTHDDLYQRARPLSAEEAASGKFSIFDIVLPTPGFDIDYPSNDIGDFYKAFMGSERGGGLDPADMRRKIKDFSLSGSYRKLIARVGKDLAFEIKTYQDETEQLVETDLEKLQKSRGQNPHVGNARNDDRHDNKLLYNNPGGLQTDFHGNAGGRDGRTNNSSSNRYASVGQENVQPSRAAPPSFRDHPKLSHPSVAAKLAAWQELPAKLAADDKAAATEWEARPLRNPDEIYQPIYKDTFIETSAEHEGCRTGHVSTDFIDTEGNIKTELEVVSAFTSSAVNEDPKELNVGAPTPVPDGKDVDTRGSQTSAVTAIVVEESFYSAGDPQDGGLTLFAAPSLRPVDSPTIPILPECITDGGIKAILQMPPVEPIVKGVYAAPFEEPEQLPAKIAVIIKFQLGTSQYATMALRELMKLGGVKTYKPDFSMGR